jgi:hypothetical protein
MTCSGIIFPFNHYSEDHKFLEVLSELWQNYKSLPYKKLENMVFNPFEWNDENPNLPNFDIDPDIQYFNDMTFTDNINSCNYYMPEDVIRIVQNGDINPDSFSLIHANLRSMPRNLDEFQLLLREISYNFKIIGITETWLTESNCDCYGMNGYKHEYLCRKEGKRGGGVSLLVKENIEHVAVQ